MLKRVLGLLACAGDGERPRHDVVDLVFERRQLTPLRTAPAAQAMDRGDGAAALEVTTRRGVEAALHRLRVYQEERLARELALAKPAEDG